MRLAALCLSWLLIGLGAVFLCLDLYNFADSGSFAATDFGALWHSLHSNSLQLLQPAIERHVHPYLWHPVMTSILLTPAFLILLVPGLVLLGLRVDLRSCGTNRSAPHMIACPGLKSCERPSRPWLD